MDNTAIVLISDLAVAAAHPLTKHLLPPPNRPLPPNPRAALHPYDPTEFPLTLPFALAHTSDPAAEPAFIATLTFLGGRGMMLMFGELPQCELVRAHKAVYSGVGWGWEDVGRAAAMEVYRGAFLERRWVVRDRSEFIGRCLGECWRVLEKGGVKNSEEEGGGRQRALDEAGGVAVRLWGRVREDTERGPGGMVKRWGGRLIASIRRAKTI